MPGRARCNRNSTPRISSIWPASAKLCRPWSRRNAPGKVGSPRTSLTPLRLEYRLLETDVKEALRRIVSTMKLDLRPDLVAGTGMLKLADTASFDWTERVQKHLFNLS